MVMSFMNQGEVWLIIPNKLIKMIIKSGNILNEILNNNNSNICSKC